MLGGDAPGGGFGHAVSLVAPGDVALGGKGACKPRAAVVGVGDLSGVAFSSAEPAGGGFAGITA